MATVVSNDTVNPTDVFTMHGTKLKRTAGVFIFASTDTTCDLPIKFNMVCGITFTAFGPETVAPTSTESANIVGHFWTRPSTGLMNLTRSAGTTSGLKVMYEYWGW